MLLLPFFFCGDSLVRYHPHSFFLKKYSVDSYTDSMKLNILDIPLDETIVIFMLE